MATEDVRSALLDHVHVAECTVSELVDDVGRSWMTAFVVTLDDVESDLASLAQHVRDVLPGHRQPDDVRVVDELPHDPDEAARSRRGYSDDTSV